jgi:hypothetical protein
VTVALVWIPVGADGTGLVIAGSRWYERLVARRERRAPAALYHAALLVDVDGVGFAIEVAEAWGHPPGERGVVAEGPVGLRALGRWPLFRYEVRCWRGGAVPDLDHAVGAPHTWRAPEGGAARLVQLTADVPRLVWGRDELGVGDMWNSNSVAAWLLVRSGHDVDHVRPPVGGRAPGWRAGLVAAEHPPAHAAHNPHDAGAAAPGAVSRLGRTRRRG